LQTGDSATDLRGHGEIIVLVGTTGSGKSTLSKFMRKHPTLKIAKVYGNGDDAYDVSVEDDDEPDLMFVDNDVTIGSTNSHASMTFIPNIDEDPQTGILIVDCAGFQDTRSPELDLLAAFLNKKVVDNGVRIKIIIIENFINLQLSVSRIGFTNTLKHVANLIGSNLHSFNGSIGLVANKIESTRKDKTVMRSIKEFLKTTSKYLEGEQQKAENSGDLISSDVLLKQYYIVDYLLKGNNFALFRRPREIGDPWKLEPLAKNYAQIRNLTFHKLNFTSDLKNKFEVAVAPATINYINEKVLSSTYEKIVRIFRELLEALHKSYDDTFDIKMKPIDLKIAFVIKRCEDHYKFLEGIDSIVKFFSFSNRRELDNSMLLELQFQISKYHFLYEVVKKDVKEISQEIREFFGEKEKLKQYLHSKEQFYTFLGALSHEFGTYTVELSANNTKHIFKSINNNSTFNTLVINLRKLGFSDKISHFALSLNKTKFENFNDLISFIEEKTDNPLDLERIRGSVIFRARFIILSKILEGIIKNFDAREIVIIASQKLFIDCNLNLRRMKLVIFAPLVEIVEEQRTIYLKGEDGLPKVQGHAKRSVIRGANGDNGRSGTSGCSSGSFRLYALDILNPRLLAVIKQGGNGGHGENGGSGFNAIGSPLPNIQNFKTYHKNNLVTISETHGYKVQVHSNYAIRDINDFFSHLVYTRKSKPKSLLLRVENTQNYVPPTSGGNGGNAGLGAPAGGHTLLINSNASNYITIESINGNDGKPGLGGKAGSNASSCSFRYYNCLDRVAWGAPGYISIVDWVCNETSSFGDCSSDIPNDNIKVYDGVVGKLGSNRVNCKNGDDVEEFHLLVMLSKYLVRQNYHAIENDLLTENFFDYILATPEILNSLKVEHYLHFLQSTADMIYGPFRLSNLNYVYHKIYASFKKFISVCYTCKSAHIKVVNLMFISRLDSLTSASTGKQVSKLVAYLDFALDELNAIAKNVKDVGIIETVEEKKRLLHNEINYAKQLMESIQSSRMAELKKEIDMQFGKLLDEKDSLQVEHVKNIRELESYHRKLSDALVKKSILGSINIFGLLGAIFWSPAAVIGSTINSIGTHFLVSERLKRSETNQVLEYVHKAQHLINEFEKNTTEDIILQLSPFVIAMQEVIAAENKTGEFLQAANRNKIKEIVGKINQGFSRGEDALVVLENSSSMFKSLEDDLNSKIKLLNNNTSLKHLLSEVKNGLHFAGNIANSAGAVVKIINDNTNDKFKLKRITAAIEQRKVALKELAVYERSLYVEFKPMLSALLSNFDQFKSGISDQSSLMLLFQKLEVKKNARKFISIINKFTKDFIRENQAFSSIIFELEEFMTTLIDAFDMIHELENRAHLADFLGQIQGGQCMKSLTSNADTCNQLLNVSVTIQTNEMVRKFFFILSAYQQVLFPYGGEKLNVFKSSLSLLENNTNLTTNEMAIVLQKALGIIKKDLVDSNNAITDQTAKNISKAFFHSKYVSSRPFFVWPSSIYLQEIKAFLNGEQITMVASVFTQGIKNAVKFNSVMLNFKSENSTVENEINRLLDHFAIEMIHSGESHYRCGSTYYVIGGEKLTFIESFEKDKNDDSVSKNKVAHQLKYGDVPLSPYTVWKFRLIHRSSKHLLNNLRQKLLLLASSIDLELVGSGYFLEEGASICDTDLGKYYNYF